MSGNKNRSIQITHPVLEETFAWAALNPTTTQMNKQYAKMENDIEDTYLVWMIDNSGFLGLEGELELQFMTHIISQGINQF